VKTHTILALIVDQQSLRSQATLHNVAQRGASDVVPDADDAYEGSVRAQRRKQSLHLLALSLPYLAVGQDHHVVAAAAGHFQVHDFLNCTKQLCATHATYGVHFACDGSDVLGAGGYDAGAFDIDSAAAAAKQIDGER
jgi:hypothetical protein